MNSDYFTPPTFDPKSRLRFCVISLKRAPFHDASGIGGILLHAEKRGRSCHFTAHSGSIFRVLKQSKNETLRATVATAQAARDVAERRIREKLNPSAGGAAEDQDKVAQAENRAAKAEAELAKIQKENADLQTKLDGNQKEIASLQTPVQQAEKIRMLRRLTTPPRQRRPQICSRKSMIFAVKWTARKRKGFPFRKAPRHPGSRRAAEGRKETAGSRPRDCAPPNRFARDDPCSQSGVQLRSIESRHPPRSRVECGDACSAGRSVGRKNSHFFS